MENQKNSYSADKGMLEKYGQTKKKRAAVAIGQAVFHQSLKLASQKVLTGGKLDLKDVGFLKNVAKETAQRAAMQYGMERIQGRSVLRKYNDQGKRIKGKAGSTNREEIAAMGVNVAMYAKVAAQIMGNHHMYKKGKAGEKTRAAQEATKNFLLEAPSKYGNVLFRDGKGLEVHG